VIVAASNDANRFRNRSITVRTSLFLPGTDNGWLNASRICGSQSVRPASFFENNKPRSRSRSAAATAISNCIWLPKMQMAASYSISSSVSSRQSRVEAL